MAAAAAGLGAAIVSPAAATVPSNGGSVDLAPERRTLLRRAAIAGLLGGLVLLGLALLSRAIVVGHAPWSNLHEFTIAFAAALLTTYLLLLHTAPIAALAPLAALLGAGLVGIALGLDDRVDPLVPALGGLAAAAGGRAGPRRGASARPARADWWPVLIRRY